MRGLARWLREPLLHFAVLGALLFALQRSNVPSPQAHRIDLSDDVVAGLRQDHLRRTGALPGAAEEAGLVQRYIETEMLYREALALGLDRGDVIVRRRLVQKMEFVLENQNLPADPSDDNLQRFLERHAARYATPVRLTFTHVFISTDRHGARSAALAEELRARLLAGAEASSSGDPFLHGATFVGRSEADIAAMFGESFARQLATVDLNTWTAPLHSSFGWHVVRVSQRSASALPPLAAVQQRVLSDWEEEQRAAARQEGLGKLRASYEVNRVKK
jgi:hypothetical protein